MSRRVGHKVLGRTPWMRIAEVDYNDRGSIRKWNVCERTQPDAPDDAPPPPNLDQFDAVDIAAIISKKEWGEGPGNNRKLIVISQYRPPVDAVVLEFPAGMIDPGEEPEVTALRELKEETGYEGTNIIDCSKNVAPLAYEPGLTNSCFALVTVEVDGDAPGNVNPQAEPEEDEDISVHLVDYGPEIMADLQKLVVELNATNTEKVPVRTCIDGKLYTFASALAIAGKLLSPSSANKAE